jgi:transcriptional regulator GlxA family with amidase domain
VLSAWAAFSDRSIDVVTVAGSRQPVEAGHGLGLVPDTTWRALGRPDVLVVGGGGRQMESQTFLDRVRGFARDGTLMTSVCTGALVYAAAGLLDGKAATTHWSAISYLQSYGTIDVKPDKRFVDAGTVVTAAGVSAGIDMALRLVEVLFDRTAAEASQLMIEYDPQPPFDAGATHKVGDAVMTRVIEYAAARN